MYTAAYGNNSLEHCLRSHPQGSCHFMHVIVDNYLWRDASASTLKTLDWFSTLSLDCLLFFYRCWSKWTAIFNNCAEDMSIAMEQGFLKPADKIAVIGERTFPMVIIANNYQWTKHQINTPSLPLFPSIDNQVNTVLYIHKTSSNMLNSYQFILRLSFIRYTNTQSMVTVTTFSWRECIRKVLCLWMTL